MTDYITRLLEGESVEWRTLGEVCELRKGKQLNKTALTETGLYPAYNGGINPSGFTDSYNYDADTIIISQGGASAGFVNFVTTPFYANAHCYVVLPNTEIVLNKFVYYILKKEQDNLMGKQLGAGIPALKASDVLTLTIPIPPMRVQRRIVEVLDQLTELHDELIEKLESEMEGRRRQYAYYREKLLSFNNVNTEGGDN